MARRVNDLGADPIGPLLARLAVPAITAQLVNALYNIVDRMYIGHMEGVGDVALTGLGVCFPVLMFLSALSALVGQGGGARAAIRLGENRLDQANEILGGCAALLLLLSAVVTVVFQLGKTPMLLLFGASEHTIGFATQYLSIYLWGTIFVQISLGLNPFISNQGFSTVSMGTVLIGAGVNIVLDPILIFGLNLGVRGAALATVLAQAVSALWVLRFLTGSRSKLRLQRRCFRLRPRVLLPVLAIGVSPFIMQATESLVNISLNANLQRYGGDLYVGAMTIASSIMQVLVMPFVGLSQGCQPIVGFNFGAGKLARVKQAFQLLFLSSVALSTAGWALVQLFPAAFVAIFNDKPALVSTTVWALRVYMAGMLMLGVQFSCQNTFVALGEAKASLFLALLRKVILLIPLAYLLPLVLTDNRVFAVYLAEPVADVLAALSTGLMFLCRFPRILERRRRELAG